MLIRKQDLVIISPCDIYNQNLGRKFFFSELKIKLAKL
jgi:hypothetical protein